jgi:hypothetical protein
MDWCSVYLTPQALPKYIYLSPPLIFPTTSTELGQKTSWCESLRVLLHYVEWDRFVTLAGANANWGLRYRIYIFTRLNWISLFTGPKKISSFSYSGCFQPKATNFPFLVLVAQINCIYIFLNIFKNKSRGEVLCYNRAKINSFILKCLENS